MKINSYKCLWAVILLIITPFTNALSTGSIKIESAVLNTALINRVSLIPESNKHYSLQIRLTTNSFHYNDWQIGFFILKVLQNPALKPQMTICNEKLATNCSQLIIVSQPPLKTVAEVNLPDLTSGHVIILKPASNFPLISNGNYLITISGLTYPPQNISMMPQSFFLMQANKIMPLAVENYQINGYNQAAVESAESQQIKARWLVGKATIPLVDTPIIPRPQQVTLSAGQYILKNKLLFPQFINCQDASDVCRTLQHNPEGYVLKLESSQPLIYAFNSTGEFYARQSLSQLIDYYPQAIPAQTVVDYPQYRYRGIMLDSVRHFFSVAQLEKLLDVMANQKLNTLHLHLADDEGWRVELANYPQLTKISAKRFQGHQIGPSNLIDGNFDISNWDHESYATAATNYHGYYSQQQIRALIKYANARSITIIPEIEMPGHARALKKAYPDVLYDFDQPSDFLSVQGYTDNVLPIYNYTRDSQFTRLLNGITNVLGQLFSQQTTIYAIDNELSLSGDEVPANAYPRQQFGAELNHQFFAKLATQNPRLVISGWQQLVQQDDGIIPDYALPAKRSGHIWEWMPVNNPRGVSGLQQAQNLLEHGYPLVADFADYTYLDMRYSREFFEPGLYWSASEVSTWSTYSVGEQLLKLNKYPNLLGVEGALWSELIPGNAHYWYMLMPKMTGIAEAGWSNPENDSWQDFAKRLGDGQQGYLAYIYRHYQIIYRGFPHGIILEAPEIS